MLLLLFVSQPFLRPYGMLKKTVESDIDPSEP